MENNFIWTDDKVMEFVLTECNKYNTWDKSGLANFIDKFKQKKAAFITDDNVTVYEGDKVYLVDGTLLNCVVPMPVTKRVKDIYYFSTREVAEDFMLYNHKGLSIYDVEKLCVLQEDIKQKLFDLIKSRL